MNDRRTGNMKRRAWFGKDTAELRAEEQKVLVALIFYVILVLSAIWGVEVLDRHLAAQDQSSAAMPA
ncbi:MAG: hypothetical protein AB7G68_11195 [Nitrospiraceae bacterium]